jgi:hypothetical protein
MDKYAVSMNLSTNIQASIIQARTKKAFEAKLKKELAANGNATPKVERYYAIVIF